MPELQASQGSPRLRGSPSKLARVSHSQGCQQTAEDLQPCSLLWLLAGLTSSPHGPPLGCLVSPSPELLHIMAAGLPHSKSRVKREGERVSMQMKRETEKEKGVGKLKVETSLFFFKPQTGKHISALCCILFSRSLQVSPCSRGELSSIF